MNLEEEVKEARNKAPKHTHLGKVAPTPEILPIDKLPYPQQFQKKNLDTQFSHFFRYV